MRRYPIPASVRRYFGRAGSTSSFLRSCSCHTKVVELIFMVWSPYFLQYLAMGYDLVCVTDQNLQQVVFDPREVDFSASNKTALFLRSTSMSPVRNTAAVSSVVASVKRRSATRRRASISPTAKGLLMKSSAPASRQ